MLQKSKRPYFKRTWLKFILYSSYEEFAEPVFLYPAAFCSTRNGILSGFLFRGMVRNGIPRVCFSTPVTHLIERYFLTIWWGVESMLIQTVLLKWR